MVSIKETKRDYKKLSPEIKNALSVAMEFISPVDNTTPIVALFTGFKNDSQNSKLGAMITVYIHLKNGMPHENTKTGKDVAICGNCPLRPIMKIKGGCYVNKGHAPHAVHSSYLKGNIPTLNNTQELITLLINRGYQIRWGEYGDPSMLPFEFINEVMQAVEPYGIGQTSYVHQWQESWFDPSHFKYAMASIDVQKNTLPLLQALHGDNVRYYRITESKEDLLANEVHCPHKLEDNKTVRVQCKDCGLCGGSKMSAKNITQINIKK